MNKYTTSSKSQLLSKRLERVASVLNNGLSTGSFQTQEEIIQETVKTLSTFYKDLDSPLFSAPGVASGDIPEDGIYNLIFNQILDDLTILFAEFENLEQLTVANFNYSATESNRLNARLRAISSKLGDYILYSKQPTKDSVFASDSFNDLSKIELNSKLLNKPECNINREEGIITLPINRDKTVTIKIKERPIINANSNGVIGNNQQVGAQYRGNILDILDGNPDTWFEYERVVSLEDDDAIPLTLDLSLNLGSEQIINYIWINPNNFGTKTSIKIDDISTSLDGKIFTSIKDDIPISGFVTEDEENLFMLAPATSKYTGQGLYTFIPRKAKYIHLVFIQTEPYLIETVDADKLRYAIGLRDIEVQGQVFLPEGECVSKPFEFNDEVKKVILKTNQNPSQYSELANISYFLSPDNGQTWSQIQPKNFLGLSGQQSPIPEILSFNLDDDNAVATSAPPFNLRLKAVLKRNDNAFEAGSPVSKQQVESVTELQNVTGSFPFQLKLTQVPIKDSVQIIDPFAGSCGIEEAAFYCGTGLQSYSLFSLNFDNRPFEKVLNGTVYDTVPVSDSDWIHVIVDGEEWEASTVPIDDSSEAVYYIDRVNNVLQLGYGEIDSHTISKTSRVNIYYEPQQLDVRNSKGIYLADLDFPTTNDKNALTLKRYNDVEATIETLPRLATVVRLANQNILNYAGITSQLSANGYAASPTAFINGIDELSDADDWSIDIDAGIIYLKTPTSAVTEIEISYTYQPIVTLAQTDWDWAHDDNLKTIIQIKDSGWKSREIVNVNLPIFANARALSLPNRHIVPGSIKFSLLNGDGDAVKDMTTEGDDGSITYTGRTLDPFAQEVPFQDGLTELGVSYTITTEYLRHDWLTVESCLVWNFGHPLATDTNRKIALSPTLMDPNFGVCFEEKTSIASVVDFGDYFIDRVTSKLYIYRYELPGVVSQKFLNPYFSVTYSYATPNDKNQGLYSIDYSSGRIFTQRALDVSWDLTVEYQYVDYRAEYRIARYISPDNFNVDYAASLVTIKPEEVLQRILMPDIGNSYYQINYSHLSASTEKIDELRDYFSPVLKDYILKIITKGKLL